MIIQQAKVIFDTHWKVIRTELANDASTAALVSQLPRKSEVWCSIVNRDYARERYHNVEALNGFQFIVLRLAAKATTIHDSITLFALLEQRGY